MRTTLIVSAALLAGAFPAMARDTAPPPTVTYGYFNDEGNIRRWLPDEHRVYGTPTDRPRAFVPEPAPQDDSWRMGTTPPRPYERSGTAMPGYYYDEGGYVPATPR